MRYHHSLERATRILETLFKEIGSAEDGITVRAWSNCREQGYCISSYLTDLTIVFAEARSSDDIVVVHGRRDHFHLQTNQPNQELWETNRKYLTTEEETVDHILHLLKFEITTESGD